MSKTTSIPRATFCLLPAGQELAADNRGLCGEIAKRFLGRGRSFDELVSAGFEGLCHAAAHYRPETGYRFTTFAAFWVRRAMLDEIWNVRMVRLPKMCPRAPALREHWSAHRGHGAYVAIRDEGLWSEDAPDDPEGDDGRLRLLRAAIDALPDDYREVIERRLTGETQASIGRSHGRTRSCISLLEARAVRCLQRRLRSTI